MIVNIQNKLVDTEKIFAITETEGDYRVSLDKHFHSYPSGYSYFFKIYAIGVENYLLVAFHSENGKNDEFLKKVNEARNKLVEYWNISKSKIPLIEM